MTLDPKAILTAENGTDDKARKPLNVPTEVGARESCGVPERSDQCCGLVGFFRDSFLLGAVRRVHLDNNYATLIFLIWPQRLPEFPVLREGTSFRLIRDHICLRGRFLASSGAGSPLTASGGMASGGRCTHVPPTSS